MQCSSSYGVERVLFLNAAARRPVAFRSGRRLAGKKGAKSTADSDRARINIGGRPSDRHSSPSEHSKQHHEGPGELSLQRAVPQRRL